MEKLFGKLQSCHKTYKILSNSINFNFYFSRILSLMFLLNSQSIYGINSKFSSKSLPEGGFPTCWQLSTLSHVYLIWYFSLSSWKKLALAAESTNICSVEFKSWFNVFAEQLTRRTSSLKFKFWANFSQLETQLQRNSFSSRHLHQ